MNKACAHKGKGVARNGLHLLVMLLSCVASELAAESFDYFPRTLDEIEGLAPFDPESLLTQASAEAVPANKEILQLSQSSLDIHVRDLLGMHLHPAIEVQSTSVKTGLTLTAPRALSSFNFYIDNIKFCDYQVKASSIAGFAPFVIGKAPNVLDVSEYTQGEWPDLDSALALVQASAESEYKVSGFTLAAKDQCFKVDHQMLRPAWRLTLRTGENLLYVGTADEQKVYDLAPEFCEIDGSAKIYRRNIGDKVKQSYPLKNLDGSGNLTNDFFKTQLYGSTSQSARAQSSSNVFDFSDASSQFQETSLFTNANRMHSWYVDQGYDFGSHFPDGIVPITIWVHAVINGSVNNALYQPESNGGGDIFITDGDGVILQNLATDSDVVMHEFSHHLIYRSITNIGNHESLVIHEGLADTFAMVHSGDPCLGETICPQNSPLCVTDTCLRSADNSYKFGDADLPTEAHQESQFISGMFWDLKTIDGVSSAQLIQLVLAAIDHLPSSADFGNLIAALLVTDLTQTKGANCVKIYKRAIARGLYGRISDFGCGSGVAASDPAAAKAYPNILKDLPSGQDLLNGADSGALSVATANSAGSTQQSSGGSKVGICGGIAADMGSPSGALIIFWLVPLVLVFSRSVFFRKWRA